MIHPTPLFAYHIVCYKEFTLPSKLAVDQIHPTPVCCIKYQKDLLYKGLEGGHISDTSHPLPPKARLLVILPFYCLRVWGVVPHLRRSPTLCVASMERGGAIGLAAK